jgi:hypothetical protein
MASFSATIAIVFFSMCCCLPTAPVAGLSFDYTTFRPEDQKDIGVEGDAYISSGWIDLTANRLSSIGHSKGRASYNAQHRRCGELHHALLLRHRPAEGLGGGYA